MAQFPSILAGAGSGAMAGAPLGPWGIAGGAILGGGLGFLAGDAQDDANRRAAEAAREAQAEYRRLSELQWQRQQQGMNKQLELYGPLDHLYSQMYGSMGSGVRPAGAPAASASVKAAPGRSVAGMLGGAGPATPSDPIAYLNRQFKKGPR